MKKKNVFKISSIILVVIGIVLISLSFIVSDKKEMKPDDNANNSEDNVEVKPSTPDDTKPSLTYKEVYDMAVSLYGGAGITIEVVEEDDKFVINRNSNASDNVETYFVDKITGSISVADVVISDGTSG
jgi:hypothetical protein